MSVLKIKDINGDWIEIVALQGSQGEPGPQGPIGETGPQGEPGENGKDYVLTTTDMDNIAELVIEKLPVYNGEVL